MKIKFDKICYDLKFFLEDIFKISIDIKKLKCQNKTKEKDLKKYMRRDKNVEV